MSFLLFILVNATLFLRPGEIIPDLVGVSLYEYLIVACVFVSLPEIIQYFTSGSWTSKPIACCVAGILASVVISQLAALNLADAWRTGVFFLKVVVYFVLLISVVNTPARLRGFVFWLAVFTAALTLVTVLQFHGAIELPTLRVLRDVDVDPATGEHNFFQRLQGSGAFQDPNELCVIVAAMVPLCLFQLCRRDRGVSRLLWLGPLLLFLYGIALTKSRGGFLALLAGLGVLTWRRFGPRRTLAIACLGLPVVFLAFAGRQTDLSASTGTGQTRVQVWSDWLYEFRSAPIFGKGMDLKDARPQEEEVKLVAHNSFLHSFTELGLFGGMMFVGAFYFALASLYRFRPERTSIDDDQLRQLYPFLFGTLTAFLMGLMSLSLCYVIPTYLMLGLVTAYARVTPHGSSLSPPALNGPFVGRVAIAGFSFLAGMYIFIRLFINWG